MPKERKGRKKSLPLRNVVNKILETKGKSMAVSYFAGKDGRKKKGRPKN